MADPKDEPIELFTDEAAFANSKQFARLREACTDMYLRKQIDINPSNLVVCQTGAAVKIAKDKGFERLGIAFGYGMIYSKPQ